MTDPSTDRPAPGSHPSDAPASDASVLPLALVPLLRPGEAVRPVPGASRYFATSTGRLLSIVRGPREVRAYARKSNGYLQVEVWYDRDDGSTYRRTVYVHVIVAEAFLGPRPASPGVAFDVDHANGDRLDNRAVNLRYLPRADNVRRPFREGTHSAAKLSAAGVWVLRCRSHAALVSADSDRAVVTEAAARHGVTATTVRAALAGRSWRWVPDPADRPSASVLAEALGVVVPEAERLLALSPFVSAGDLDHEGARSAVIVPIRSHRPAA